MHLDAKLEALLFAAGRAVGVPRLAEWSEAKRDDVREALDALSERLRQSGSGLQLLRHGEEAELVTHPDAASAARQVAREELEGELTRPSLEALAVLAYRGPLTRPELEQIRGVQSSLILRNLLLRGLVEVKEDTRLGQPVYAVTTNFLKTLGLDRLASLPDFERLHQEPAVERVLEELQADESRRAPADQTLDV